MNVYGKCFGVCIALFAPVSLFAAGSIDHFEVSLNKEEAKVDEALDLTITAVDKNGETVTDYLGDILVFSESDPEAEFPNDLSENSYTFITANEGEVKFENAVKFHNTGNQDIYVYDLNDENILGVAEIAIDENSAPASQDIEILSPENGITIGKDTTTVSGKTQKNHQVKILVNNKDELMTTSNSDGIFEQEVTLQDGTNSLKAIVLDADNKSLGESSQIQIKVNADMPQFKNITITPSWEVEAESNISIQVVSNSNLSSVSAIIDDVIISLSEGKDGIYSGTALAPKTPGNYSVDIVMKDDFGHEAREREVEKLIVIPALNTGTGTVILEVPKQTFDNEKPLKELDLMITNIQVTELKSRSIITWNALPDAQSYNVYKKVSPTQVELVANVKEPRFEIPIAPGEETYDDFAIKAVGINESGEEVQGDFSDMTRVQTGPALYIFLALFALLLSTGFFYWRKSSAF